MATTIDQVPFAIRPLWVIDQRLAWHSKKGTGRLLDGIKYYAEGRLRSEGGSHFPNVANLGLTDEDTIAPGARGSLPSPMATAVTLTLVIRSKREYGLFRRDPESGRDDSRFSGVGCLEWVTKVRDAIVTKTDGTGDVDALLEDTLRKPVITAIREYEVDENVWEVELEVDLEVYSQCVGKRSPTLEELQVSDPESYPA